MTRQRRAARAPVTQRTDSVALVVSESEERVFGEPFFAAITRGISSGLADTSLQLWLAVAPAERERLERHLTSRRVDGVLLLSLDDSDPPRSLLEKRGVPAVLGGRPARTLPPGTAATHFVDVDDAGGARQAVERLVRSGRQRVATIAGPQDQAGGVARLAGYWDAISLNGPHVRDDIVAYGDFSESSGAVAMRELLSRRPDLDAVFVASDVMAAGALRVLRKLGRRVPDDVAVIGFEDSPIAQQTDPPLTTVHQPAEEMGRQMARLLVAQIRGEKVPRPHVLLDTHLVARASG